ncbi:MAG: phage major tail tube protein [Brevundimonas sp.]|uniref:phage major tail tube protein n=1 Tax=Brevundimonas sp. TaxID=1871086 RepID=UPI003918F251
MKLPRQLKDMNVFNAANSFAGECLSFTRPKLAIKTEAYRGGGMLGEVQLDMGLEALEVTHKYGGDIPELNREFGANELDATQLRFAGAYQNDETGGYDDVQIVVRGRHVEIDAGDDEIGSKSGTAYKTACVYYKQTRNGRVEFEVDMLAGRFVVDGVDRWAELRGITG